MGWIREEGKINDDTYLIDSMLFGREESMACYLVVGTKKKVLIDASGTTEARGIVKKLKALNLIPDILVLTHSHWDHSGGTLKIKKAFPELEIMASHMGLKSLKNQQEFNKGFSEFTPKLKPIEDVSPLKENDIIDIGGIELKIFETPGHTNCCISILDQKNKNLFLGDSLGYKPSEDLMMAPIMPPEFSEKKLLATIDKVKKIDYLTVSPAHFGCLTEDLAKKFPDEAKKFYNYWKKLLLSKWNENPTTEGMINSMKIELQKVFSDTSEQELEAFSNMFGDWYTKGLKSAKMI